MCRPYVRGRAPQTRRGVGSVSGNVLDFFQTFIASVPRLFRESKSGIEVLNVFVGFKTRIVTPEEQVFLQTRRR